MSWALRRPLSAALTALSPSFQPHLPATSYPLPCHQNDLSKTTNLSMVFSCLEKIDVDAPLPSGISSRVLAWRGQEGLALRRPFPLPLRILGTYSFSHLDGHMSLGVGAHPLPQPTFLPSYPPTVTQCLCFSDLTLFFQ